MRYANWLLAGIILSMVGGASAAEQAETAEGPLAFTVKDIDGNDVDLAKKYDGKVCLIVNVASECGLTPQYEQLAALHKKYKDKGLAILAFPANNFDEEEPGSNAEIKAFCQSKYGVEFDLFSKLSVEGDDQAPLYSFLTSKEQNGEFGGAIPWNFTKFLVGRDGQVAARFKPEVKPDAPEMVEAIEAELAKEAGGDEWDAIDEIGNLSGQAVL